jgi:hypothetical protein
VLHQAGAAIEAVFEAVFGRDAEMSRPLDVCKPDAVDVPTAVTDAGNTTNGNTTGDGGDQAGVCLPEETVTVLIPTAEGAAFGLAVLLTVLVPVAVQRRYNL